MFYRNGDRPTVLDRQNSGLALEPEAFADTKLAEAVAIRKNRNVRKVSDAPKPIARTNELVVKPVPVKPLAVVQPRPQPRLSAFEIDMFAAWSED